MVVNFAKTIKFALVYRMRLICAHIWIIFYSVYYILRKVKRKRVS